MERITSEETLDLCDRFISDKGLYFDFINFIEKEGYSEEELYTGEIE